MKTKLMMVGLMLSIFYIGCEEEAEAVAVDCVALATATTEATVA